MLNGCAWGEVPWTEAADGHDTLKEVRSCDAVAITLVDAPRREISGKTGGIGAVGLIVVWLSLSWVLKLCLVLELEMVVGFLLAMWAVAVVVAVAVTENRAQRKVTKGRDK